MIVAYLSVFTDFFGNIFNIIFVVVFLLIGVLLGVFLRPWIGNTVTKLDPDSHRFHTFNIEEETAISLRCKKVKGMPIHRFYKWKPGYTGMEGRFLRKPVTRFFGRTGTAYTSGFTDQQKIERASLSECIKVICGEQFWNEIPSKQQKLLEKSQLDVTIEIDKGALTPAGLRPISEEDIKAEEDRKCMETLWKGKKIQEKGQLINLFLAGGTGFGIAMALVLLGVIRAPAAAPESTEQAAKFLYFAVRRALHI